MLRSLIRTLCFFSQWMSEVLRQPLLMVSLVIGPFLILLLFGYGEAVGAPRPRTVLVVPTGQAGASALAIVPKQMSQYLDVIGTTTSSQQAQEELVQGKADLVAILPNSPEQTIANGQHPTIQVLTNEIDPVRASYADAYIRDQVDALNQQTIQKAISQAQGSLGSLPDFVAEAQHDVLLLQSIQGDVVKAREQVHQMHGVIDPFAAQLTQLSASVQAVPLLGMLGLAQPADQLKQLAAAVDQLKGTVDHLDDQLSGASSATGLPSSAELAQLKAELSAVNLAAAQFKAIPADVLSAPFTLILRNVAPFVPSAIGFYAPAVLVLLLQHLAVTLGALSMARVRLLGMMELFQTSPVKPPEVVVGNYLSYGVLSIVAGAALAGLLIFGLGVPVFGSVVQFIGMLLLLIFCSLGIGFIISLISSSEQQAAQIAMLVLIGSVFFSGFLVSLDTIRWPIKAVSYIFPATYAIRTLDDVMLRGVLRTPGDFATLAGVGLVLFMLMVLRLRREFQPR